MQVAIGGTGGNIFAEPGFSHAGGTGSPAAKDIYGRRIVGVSGNKATCVSGSASICGIAGIRLGGIAGVCTSRRSAPESVWVSRRKLVGSGIRIGRAAERGTLRVQCSRSALLFAYDLYPARAGYAGEQVV